MPSLSLKGWELFNEEYSNYVGGSDCSIPIRGSTHQVLVEHVVPRNVQCSILRLLSVLEHIVAVQRFV